MVIGSSSGISRYLRGMSPGRTPHRVDRRDGAVDISPVLAAASSSHLHDCTGALVAGGRAARLGGLAKGLLRTEGQPIAARTARLFEELFDDSLVVAPPGSPYAALGLPLVSDVFPGKGAPGGVHAALQASTTGWIFAAGCDMPFIDAEAIRWLAARREGADAVLVEWRGRLEPLFAFWSRRCLAPLERLLAEGDPSLRALVDEVHACVLPEEAWRAFDPEGRCFENVNTWSDVARLGLEGPGRRED
jgi:molybdopterin-guanine dinucleotide biosynthesis protein A